MIACPKLLTLLSQLTQSASGLLSAERPVLQKGMTGEDVRPVVLLLPVELAADQVGAVHVEIGAALRRGEAGFNVSCALQCATARSSNWGQIVDQLKGVVSFVVLLVEADSCRKEGR